MATPKRPPRTDSQNVAPWAAVIIGCAMVLCAGTGCEIGEDSRGDDTSQEVLDETSAPVPDWLWSDEPFCAALSGGSPEPKVIVSIPGHSLWSPTVLAGDDGLHMWLGATRPFNSRTLYFTSPDGESWSGGQPIVFPDGDPPYGVGDMSVIKHDGLFWMYFSTSGYRDGKNVQNEVDLATSIDGIAWTYQGTAFRSPSDVAAGELLLKPVVVYDGLRFHLYYTLWVDDVCEGDIGVTLDHIGHAVSEDGRTFELEAEVFAGEDCHDVCDPPRGRVSAIVQPVCDTCLTNGPLLLVAVLSECGHRDRSPYLLPVQANVDITHALPLPETMWGYSDAALLVGAEMWLFETDNINDDNLLPTDLGQITLTRHPVPPPFGACPTE